MHSIFVAKIRSVCELQKNIRKAMWINKNSVEYMATRKGVDLTPLRHESADDGKYVRYISERPKSHGLFGNFDVNEDISKIANDMFRLSQEKVIYRAIFSLRGDDAADLGYDSKQKWYDFLNANMADVAATFKIPADKLRWCGAYHNEQSHPHVHCMFWCTDDRTLNPWIHTSRQHAVRELLSGKIFEEEHKNLIAQKEAMKAIILEAGKYITDNGALMSPSKTKLDISSEQLTKITEEILNLLPKLPQKGRLNYAFMPKEIKEEIDKVTTDIIACHPSIEEAFNAYMEADTSKTYTTSKKKRIVRADAHREDLYKDLGNIILKTLKSYKQDTDLYHSTLSTLAERKCSTESFIANDEIAAEGQSMAHYDSDPTISIEHETIIEMDDGVNLITDIDTAYDIEDNSNMTVDQYSTYDLEDDPNTTIELDYVYDTNNNAQTYYVEWNESYKNATNALYVTKDYDLAANILKAESIAGNVLAMHDYAKLMERNLISGENHDLGQANELYEKALEGFKLVADTAEKQSISTYASYRVGKMYHYGTGTPVVLEEAKIWYNKASNNKYANYSHAKILLDEYNTEMPNAQKTLDKAFNLLNSSANSSNPFACYELGNQYERGSFVESDPEKAYSYYKSALDIFLSKNGDDNIQYRIGKMYELGKGTEVDLEKAIEYYSSAAKVKNEKAIYALAKLYIKTKDEEKQAQAIDMLQELYAHDESNNNATYSIGNIYTNEESAFYDINKGIEFLKLSSDSGNKYAQYKLGKIYYCSPDVAQNLPASIELLLSAAQQNVSPAYYLLGKIYLDSQSELYNMDMAVQYFQKAASLKNDFAHYQLGKIYASEESSFFDLDKALFHFNEAASQNNDFALYQLGVLHNNSELDIFNIEKAVNYFTQAVSLTNNAYANYQLGKIYSSQDSGVFDLDKALAHFNEAASQNNDFALYQLGGLHNNSELDIFDIEKAINYFTQAVSLTNNAYANYQLGKIYSSQDSGVFDLDKALAHFNEAASQNNDFALYQLGGLHNNSELDIFDIEKAINYFTQAVSLTNNAYANYQLGKIYSSQDSGVFDPKKAMNCFSESANQGNLFSLYQMGKLYLEPPFCDVKKALSILTQVAESNTAASSIAQCKLGNLYLWGKNGVAKNKEKGLYWLTQAANQGNEVAIQSIKIYEQMQRMLALNLCNRLLILLSTANQENTPTIRHGKYSDSKKAQKERLLHRNKKPQKNSDKNV